MARRYRYEYLQRKKAKEERKERKRLERSEKESTAREAIGWIVYILIVVCATYLIVTYVGQRTKVVGDSMNNTLYDGDNLIVDKISYRVRDPKRFEVIVFPYKYEEGTFYIKRIIGLPGETIQIKDGYIYIDGELLEESFGVEPMEKAGIAGEPITLGKDEYFVLGDNRNHSSDSRETSVGVLHRNELVGRAWVRIWPLSRMGAVPHD